MAKIAVLPGDGIGTEIVAEAVKVLNTLDLKFEMETALVGGAAALPASFPMASALSSTSRAAPACAATSDASLTWQADSLAF